MVEPILYSFRRCPYAMRARWAILLSGLQVKLREIDFKRKPPELLKISPKGTVPVLVHETGKVIDESLEIVTWALRHNDPLKLLALGDTRNNYELKELINENDEVFKYNLDRYKYPNRFKVTNNSHNRHIAYSILRGWNKRLAKYKKDSNNFLLGKYQSIADISIWPFVRQYRMVDPKSFDQDEDIEYLRIWLNTYVESELFKTVMCKYTIWSPLDKDSYYPRDKNIDI